MEQGATTHKPAWLQYDIFFDHNMENNGPDSETCQV